MNNHMPKSYHTKLWRGIMEFDLIDPGDHVLIGLSGGKDSLFLMYAMRILQSYSKIPFTCEAVTVDLGFPGEFDMERIAGYCSDAQVVHHVITTDIYKIIEERKARTNPCATCSFFRRAVIHRFASEHGFEKVAFAHHMDDAIETFLMNILYSGKNLALPWKTELSKTGVTVIRPLMYFSEKEIRRGVKLTGWEPLPSNCPYSDTTSRAKTKELIRAMSKDNKMVRANLVAAMRQDPKTELWPPAKRPNR